MQLTRYEPWSLIGQLHGELDRIFDRTARGDEGALADWIPAVDIEEDKERFLVRADVPGVQPEDIDVTMENGVLTLTGSRKSEQRMEHDGVHRVERVHGRFFRRFTLPDSADADRISARVTNGVLELHIPKQERAQPKRISVRKG